MINSTGKVITKELEELLTHRIVERKSYAEAPPRVGEYLTKKASI
jgi:DNA-binding HxlR family transcriptional regulator